MKYYEILYIVHPALEGGHLKDIMKSTDQLIKKNGGELLAYDNWGKKKLAYLIEKQSYGNYVLTQFSSNGEKNSNILKDLEHNSNILAYVLSNINESEILEKKAPSEESEESSDSPVEEAPAEEAPLEESEESADNEKKEAEDNESDK